MKSQQKAAVKQRLFSTAVLRDWLVVLLFFAGVALIAAGLWCIWPPVSLIFIGVAVLYFAFCIARLRNSQ